MPETAENTTGTSSRTPSRRGLLFGTAAVSATVLTACTSNEPSDAKTTDDARPAADDKPGRHVTIGFAGPQADHGWLNAINDQAKHRATSYSDVSMEVTEGSNDTPPRSARSRR
jgi:ribose transport system substrate-binding protein